VLFGIWGLVIYFTYYAAQDGNAPAVGGIEVVDVVPSFSNRDQMLLDAGKLVCICGFPMFLFFVCLYVVVRFIKWSWHVK
jgi:hypothetical protein